MLKDYQVSEEEYILARYKTIFKKKGIHTMEDLLFDFPIKYDDFKVQSLRDAKLDETIILEGTIVSKIAINYLKSKLSTVVFQLEVEGTKIRCTIFNRIYLKGKLNYGSVIRVQGKFYQSMNQFTVSNLVLVDELSRDVIPTYRIKEIADEKYFEILLTAFRKYKHQIGETLPRTYLEKYQLLSLPETVRILHFSDQLDEIAQAKKRMQYEELLQYQVSMKYLHHMRQKETGCPAICYQEEVLTQLRKKLSYDLTPDQDKAIGDILKDLSAPYAMNRLLQGEVGSGKTIVAVMALLATVSGGFQAALMCPTEILSKQHFVTLQDLLRDFSQIQIGLLTGSTSQKERKEILQKLATNEIQIIVGTHALFQTDVEYYNLGTVIADEEHRFGVRQRVLIKNKGLDVNYLKMSATPIPRTLAISAYGDTDISIIKTMPKNRKAVVTKYVDKAHKKDVMVHMKQELATGHQIYVVTPLIEESEVIDTANATEIYENMKRYFEGIATVGLIHGKLKPTEKEDIMQQFLDKEIQILVATSVIEVGVNVPNATTILILGAERFGVAALHQLRGRVMRSDSIPYCFFVTTDHPTDSSIERLKMVEQTTDGFALAEYDLKHRGPGEFFGEKQSGSMHFKYASLRENSDLLELANIDSEEMIQNGSLFVEADYQKLYEVASNNYQRKQTQLD
ncbi:MAG: ATP-dependent DNA helicase RecG [Anaeroplasma bactoclasticum]|nr:ATP-dependent DNA helicase RecG [Anaeroplasma bactoclasticum]